MWLSYLQFIIIRIAIWLVKHHSQSLNYSGIQNLTYGIVIVITLYSSFSYAPVMSLYQNFILCSATLLSLVSYACTCICWIRIKFLPSPSNLCIKNLAETIFANSIKVVTFSMQSLTQDNNNFHQWEQVMKLVKTSSWWKFLHIWYYWP